ncbi:heterokaryon incompatibility protein-domain-containing protein [Xylogone sp. PMI_703]|nr:heterokaryon incompatibility protein-domain-containing protein [Xylogone sp. PMI_703]
MAQLVKRECPLCCLGLNNSTSPYKVAMTTHPSPRRDEYTYTKLPSARSIRLLCLHPGNDAAPLVCDMKIVSLDENPFYEALSYVWGVHEFSEILQIRESRRQYRQYLTPSLAGALRRLRLEDEDRILWTDAICINQADDEEKGEQIQMMDDVYHKASSVQVWLGDAAEDSDSARDFIDQITELSSLDRLVKDPSTTRLWLALSRLMQRRWFTRRWIIQELALAQNITLHCGSRSIEWGQFADAVSLFTKRHSEISLLFQQSSEFENGAHALGELQAIGALSLVKVYNRLFRRSNDGHILSGLLTLETLVADLGSFESSIPHDTIYALLNLAGDVQRRESFPVDYRQTFNELAKLFIEFAIQSSRSLDIICRPWAPENSGPLSKGLTHWQPNNKEPSKQASWICPLSKAAYDYQLNHRFTRRNADSFLGSPGHAYYNASARLPLSNISFARDAPEGPFQSLFVRGIIHTSIVKIGDPARSGVIPSHWFDIGNWSTRRRPVPDDFWRTLVADRGFDGVNPPPWYRRACEYVFYAERYPDDVDTKQPIEHGNSSIATEFLQRVQAVVWKRRMVLTLDNSLGLVPEEAREGDAIAILFGCSVPVVLRPCVEGHYILIGQSYIHGLMDGQNLPKWEKAGRVTGDDTARMSKIIAFTNGDQPDINETRQPQFELYHKSPEPKTENAAESPFQVLELR